MNDSATPKPIFMTWFIRIILMTFWAISACSRKPEHSREAGYGKSQSLKGRREARTLRCIDGMTAFVICSNGWGADPITGEQDDDAIFEQDVSGGRRAGCTDSFRICARRGADAVGAEAGYRLWLR